MKNMLAKLKSSRHNLGQTCVKNNVRINELDGLRVVIDNLWPKLPATLSSAASSSSAAACLKYSSQKHGLIVDHQVSHYALHGEESFRKRYPSVDPCTLVAIVALETHLNMKIVDSQLPLYDGDSGIRTRLDLLCIDNASKELVLFELKTTTHSTADRFLYAASGDAMHFDNACSLPNSYYYRSMIQLLLTAIILKKEYDITVDRSYVLRVNHKTYWTYELDAQVSRMYLSIYNSIRREWRASQKNTLAE